MDVWTTIHLRHCVGIGNGTEVYGAKGALAYTINIRPWYQSWCTDWVALDAAGYTRSFRRELVYHTPFSETAEPEQGQYHRSTPT